MRYLIKVLALALIILFKLQSAFADENQPKVLISIEASDQEEWDLTYDFSRPVQKIDFLTRVPTFREASWRVVSEGVFLEKHRGAVTLNSQQPRSQFRLKIAANYNQFIRRQYTPYLLFSDASRGVFTGHFLLSGIHTAKGREQVSPGETRLRLLAGKFDTVLYKGIQAPLIKHADIGRGEYAYFGKVQATNEPRFSAIIDPDMPEWIRAELAQQIGRIFEFYCDYFAFELPSRPTIMVSYTPAPGKARSDGSRINEQVILNIVGQGWDNSAAANRINILKLLAHEMAHLWNAASPAIDGQYWSYEGSAETFAQLALFNLGMSRHEDLLRHYNKQLKVCSRSLTITAINRFNENGQGDGAYACGDLLSLIVAIEAQKQQTNLFALWRKLMEHNQSEGYEVAQWLEYIAKTSLSQDSVTAIQSLLSEHGIWSNQKLLNLLRESGIKISKSKTNYDDLGSLAMMQLMKVNCGTWSFWDMDDHIKFDAMPDCDAFTNELKIASVGGFDIWSQGNEVYEYLQQQCAQQKMVNVGLYNSNDTRQLTCPKSIPRGSLQGTITEIPL